MLLVGEIGSGEAVDRVVDIAFYSYYLVLAVATGKTLLKNLRSNRISLQGFVVKLTLCHGNVVLKHSFSNTTLIT